MTLSIFLLMTKISQLRIPKEKNIQPVPTLSPSYLTSGREDSIVPNRVKDHMKYIILDRILVP